MYTTLEIQTTLPKKSQLYKKISYTSKIQNNTYITAIEVYFDQISEQITVSNTEIAWISESEGTDRRESKREIEPEKKRNAKTLARR